MKRLLKKTGIEDTKCVFLLNDNQLKEVSFLEDVNTLLTTGDITSLYDSEEKLALIEKVTYKKTRAFIKLFVSQNITERIFLVSRVSKVSTARNDYSWFVRSVYRTRQIKSSYHVSIQSGRKESKR